MLRSTHRIYKKVRGRSKTDFIGYQPAMIDKLSKSFRIRIIDLDKDNIGKEKSGVIIEWSEKTNEVLLGSDIIMATGFTSLVMNQVDAVLGFDFLKG